MNSKIYAGFALAILALVLLPFTSAVSTGVIAYVETDSVLLYDGTVLAVTAGQSLDLRVVFNPGTNEQDVRVSARILGEPGSYEATERFDVLSGRAYSKLLHMNVPSNIDPTENYILEVRVESQSSVDGVLNAVLAVQRDSYSLKFLSIDSDSKISAGDTLPVSVVVKNNGIHIAKDTFVEARIPALGISKKVFLQDLSSNASTDKDVKDDSIEGTIYLNIPSDAPAGLYTIELEANSEDSQTLATRRVEVSGSSSSSMIIASTDSKTFAVNTDGKYSLTIVNSGNKIKVYNLVAEADSGLIVSMDDNTVVVPAGSSKTVAIMAKAKREGNYKFTVNAHGADGSVIGEQSFTAEVDGTTSQISGNAAVVLTIILAIVFVVLLVVLIVLLTRKPSKQEQSGESYY